MKGAIRTKGQTICVANFAVTQHRIQAPRVLRTSTRRESNGEGFQLLVVQPALPCNDGVRNAVRRRVVGRRPACRCLNGRREGRAGVGAFGDGADVQPPRAVREVQVRPCIVRQKTVSKSQLVHSKARIREMDRLAKVDLEVLSVPIVLIRLSTKITVVISISVLFFRGRSVTRRTALAIQGRARLGLNDRLGLRRLVRAQVAEQHRPEHSHVVS